MIVLPILLVLFRWQRFGVDEIEELLQDVSI